MINDIYNTLRDAVLCIPNGDIQPYIKVDGLYYKHTTEDTNSAAWTGYESPSEPNYISYEIISIQQEIKQTVANVRIRLEHGSLGYIDNNNIINVHKVSLLNINYVIDSFRKSCIKSTTNPILTTFRALRTEKLLNITTSETNFIMKDYLYKEACCLLDVVKNDG